MSYKILYSIILILAILFSSKSIYGQNVKDPEEDKEQIIEEKRKAKSGKSKSSSQKQTKTITTKSDSLKKSTPFSQPDTMITQQVNSQVYWYDIENIIKTRNEIATIYAFRHPEEKSLLYRNMSDIFRQQPFWFNYSFMESGRPVYISSVNSYPHQTSFYYNGVIMNDPIHGMFNSQYIPVNFIRNVQLSTAGNNLQDYGLSGTSSIHVVSSSQHTKAPW